MNDAQQKKAAKDEILGQYFEKNNFGEDFNIIMSHEEKFYGIKKFDKTKLDSISHTYCDGIAALKVLHQDHKETITLFPKNVHNIKFRWTLSFIKSFIQKHIIFIFNFPYRKFNFFEQKGSEHHLFSLSFTREQTKKIIARAKNEGISVNALFIYIIFLKTKHLYNRSNWFIPVFAPKGYANAQEASIKNHSSGFELLLKSNDTKETITQKYQTEILGAGPFYWRKSFDAMKVMIKFPIQSFVKLCMYGTRRTGVISNLGKFEGTFDGSIVCAPPVLLNNPLGIAVLTYNNELTMSVHSKENAGPSSETIEKFLTKIFKELTI